MIYSIRNWLLGTLVALLGGGLLADGAEIVFKEQANVRGSIVLLGDLAEVREADALLTEQLRRIELFPAPARGRSRTLRVVELRQLLQLHGIEAADHRFTGADSVRIAHTNSVSPKRPVPAVIDKEETAVVVAKRAISAGEILRTVDVEIKTPDKPVKNIAPAITTDAVVGQESVRALAAGQPIDTRALRKPILVHRGDPVVVVAKAAGVRVRTTAKALAEGALGDLVPLEIAENREKLSAVVTGLREAEVFASGSTVTDSNPPTRSQLGDRQ